MAKEDNKIESDVFLPVNWCRLTPFISYQSRCKKHRVRKYRNSRVPIAACFNDKSVHDKRFFPKFYLVTKNITMPEMPA